jgi:hypothetical protein
MKLKDKEAWQEVIANNITDDGYGSCGILFAALWAGEMERELAEGKNLADIADECSHTADDSMGKYGVTGFQYGLAVSLLSVCWEHGEELRRWHNLKTQFHDEGERANESGGVLNPALIKMEKAQ